MGLHGILLEKDLILVFWQNTLIPHHTPPLRLGDGLLQMEVSKRENIYIEKHLDHGHLMMVVVYK